MRCSSPPRLAAPVHRVSAVLLALVVSLLDPSATARTPEAAELYFELKLLVRPGGWLRSGAVDDWAGGRLLMARRPSAGGTRFELIRPLEDPWTFRWFPSKQEVKLGAAIAVADPAGDPYGSLAPAQAARAARLHGQWWGRDQVRRTAPLQPQWAERTERFWAGQHRGEERDPLPDHPVYPFHVLGDPSGRFRFEVGRDGSLVEESLVQRMTVPWLATGWSDWRAGRRRPGYGYWESRPSPPDWEPRTYPAMAAATRLLAWPLPDGDLSPATPDLVETALRVVAELLPRSRGRLEFASPIELRRTLDRARGELHETVVEGEARGGERRTPVRVHVWRYTATTTSGTSADATPVQDELQLLLERPGDAPVRLWIRIGYGPSSVDAEPSGG